MNPDPNQNQPAIRPPVFMVDGGDAHRLSTHGVKLLSLGVELLCILIGLAGAFFLVRPVIAGLPSWFASLAGPPLILAVVAATYYVGLYLWYRFLHRVHVNKQARDEKQASRSTEPRVDHANS